MTASELDAAYRADAHRDDPEFGYRPLADEARQAGVVMCGRTAWRICAQNGWWSSSGKKRRGKNGQRARRPTRTGSVATSQRREGRTRCG